MKVNFSKKAEWRIGATAEYIKEEFGRRAEQKFKAKFREVIRLLADNPYLGPIEPLLADLPQTYRSVLVAKVNKIVYRIVDDRTEIADLWDCRREPDTLASQVK